MVKRLRICVVFFYSDCTRIYHYANLTIPDDIRDDAVKCAFEEMHDSFCDASFYCRESKESDGEYLFKQVCEKNKWLYTDFIEECDDTLNGSSFQNDSDTLAKQLGIEPAQLTIDIYDDGV